MSLEARRLLSLDMVHRYSARDQFYGGTKFIDELEVFVSKIASTVFKVKHADVRPLSGHICNLTTLAAFANNGNSIMCVSPESGGYPGISHLGLGSLLKLRNTYFPYDEENMNLKIEDTRKIIEKDEPNLIIFGSSFIPFPHPVSTLKDYFKKTIPIYDGSHVLGLIAGQQFQDPLREGCRILIGSTHKSFFGPQGGIILTQDDELFQKLETILVPVIIDNVHCNRIAALGQSLLEMKKFGAEYALQVIRNSKSLARQLHDLGLPVLGKMHDYTESHQIIVDYKNQEIANNVSINLESINVIVDKGIRIGTSEVTRRGMKEPEMDKIGQIIGDALKDGTDGALLRKRVSVIASEFEEPKFSLN